MEYTDLASSQGGRSGIWGFTYLKLTGIHVDLCPWVGFGFSGTTRSRSAERMKKYQDHYFKKAKQENYPARSVYKLKEIDRQFKLLAPGQRVLDLGACPGSWSLFLAEKVGKSGRVIGADLNCPEIGFPSQVTFIQADVFDRPPELETLLAETGPFHGVVSDMAPKTTGIKMADQARSLDLVREAFEVARLWLRPGGFFIAKVFEGPDVHGYTSEIRPFFTKLRAFKPKSTRSESKETFLVGTGFKGAE